MKRITTLVLLVTFSYVAQCREKSLLRSADSSKMQWITPSPDGSHFIYSKTGNTFVVWGCNYDHDNLGTLLEDYWLKDWDAVVNDFGGLKELGANVVRIHLQFSKFMDSPVKPDEVSLKQLARLVKLAETDGIYIDFTGLGCYHKQDVPDWYTRMDETARWDAQAVFWRAVSKVCANSPAIFCYDLVNEPFVSGGPNNTEWLGGHMGDMFFDQFLTLDLKGRTQEQVAVAWVSKMVSAIHENDSRHMITIGINPIHFDFHGGNDVFASAAVNKYLDYVSIHIYPEHGKVDWAVKSVDYYHLPGKPLLEEEMFPLSCSTAEIDTFINRTRGTLNGYISFYWGKKVNPAWGVNGAIANAWYEYVKAKGPEIKKPVPVNN